MGQASGRRVFFSEARDSAWEFCCVQSGTGRGTSPRHSLVLSCQCPLPSFYGWTHDKCLGRFLRVPEGFDGKLLSRYFQTLKTWTVHVAEATGKSNRRNKDFFCLLVLTAFWRSVVSLVLIIKWKGPEGKKFMPESFEFWGLFKHSENRIAQKTLRLLWGDQSINSV